jgi:hypothetical protein
MPSAQALKNQRPLFVSSSRLSKSYNTNARSSSGESFPRDCKLKNRDGDRE